MLVQSAIGAYCILKRIYHVFYKIMEDKQGTEKMFLLGHCYHHIWHFELRYADHIELFRSSFANNKIKSE